MPAFVYAALAALAPLLQAMVFKILLALGVGVATYTGLSTVMGSITSEINTAYGGLSADILAMAYMLNIDRAINLLMSAVLARLTLAGMSGAGNLSRFKVS